MDLRDPARVISRDNKFLHPRSHLTGLQVLFLFLGNSLLGLTQKEGLARFSFEATTPYSWFSASVLLTAPIRVSRLFHFLNFTLEILTRLTFIPVSKSQRMMGFPLARPFNIE